MNRWVFAIAVLALAPGCGDDEVGAGDGGSGETDGGETDGGKTDGGTAGVCTADADCEDGNACTVNRCNDDGSCTAVAVMSNACRPQIGIEFPPRGATLVGDADDRAVTVIGTVTSAAAELASLTLNGNPVTVGGDGRFSYDVTAVVGGNTLDLLATDGLGAERRRVQAFLWSSDYLEPKQAPGEMVAKALAFYLSQEALDDGDRSLPADDMATILNLALDGFDVAQFLDPTTPMTSSAGYDVYLTDLSLGSTLV